MLYLGGEPAAMLAALPAALESAGAALVDIGLGRASLEDVFIALTGRGLR